jgi:uncharacterized protein DUF790
MGAQGSPLPQGPRDLLHYTLTSAARLVSHYPRFPEFDSLLEEAFFKRWVGLETPWTLEREVEVSILRAQSFSPTSPCDTPTGALSMWRSWGSGTLTTSSGSSRK